MSHPRFAKLSRRLPTCSPSNRRRHARRIAATPHRGGLRSRSPVRTERLYYGHAASVGRQGFCPAPGLVVSGRPSHRAIATVIAMRAAQLASR